MLQLYRCYIVWQSKLIIIFPVVLWCSAGGMFATRVAVTYHLSHFLSDWIYELLLLHRGDTSRGFWWGHLAMGHSVLGNLAVSKSVNDSYVPIHP